MNRDAIDLSTLNVFALFGKYFIPTLLGMLCISSVTAIDGIFVGHGIGSDGIAAINICVPMLMLFTGFALMVGAGCSVVASVQLSRGKERVARFNVTQALIFATLAGVLVSGLMVGFPESTARLLGASDHLLPMVKEYMLWYVPSWTFMIWTAISLFIIRLDGSPKFAMMCSVISGLTNIFLDWLFIFPFGWGLMGAAFASSVSTVIGGLMAISYLLFHAASLRLLVPKWSITSLKLSARNIWYQCRIGFSGLLGESTLAVLMFTGNLVFMHYLGDDGVGAFGIACYYAPFIFMVGNAIAQSAQPIVSYNFGLGASDRVRETRNIAVLAAIACGAAVTLVFSLFPKALVGLFISMDNEAARIAVSGLPGFAAGFIFFILNVTAIGYYQSVERVLPATVFALMRGLIFLIPAFILLPKILSSDGIWSAMPLSELLTTVSIAIFVLARRRKRQRANPPGRDCPWRGASR